MTVVILCNYFYIIYVSIRVPVVDDLVGYVYPTPTPILSAYRELCHRYEIASDKRSPSPYITSDMYITCNLNVTYTNLRNSSASHTGRRERGISSFINEKLGFGMFHNSSTRKSETRLRAKQFLKIQRYSSHNFHYIETIICSTSL